MGYGSTSHMTIANNKQRKVLKFNRRITKHRRHTHINNNNDHLHIQQVHNNNRHRPSIGSKRHLRKRSHCQQFALSFSPEYRPASPLISIRPLSYSDEYKPQKTLFLQQETTQNYSGYIDSLMLLKMQRQQQRNLQLIEKLGRITFQQQQQDNNLNRKEGISVEK